MDAIEILIADDHAAFRRNLRLLVEAQGEWQVCGEAADGEEAVAKANLLRPHIVLMDITMPRMDGLEATRIIRQQLPHSAVIVISQNDPAVASRQAAEAGAFAYVAKNNVAKDLFPTLQKLATGNGNHKPAEVVIERKAREAPAVSAVSPFDSLSASGEMAALMRSIERHKKLRRPSRLRRESDCRCN